MKKGLRMMIVGGACNAPMLLLMMMRTGVILQLQPFLLLDYFDDVGDDGDDDDVDDCDENLGLESKLPPALCQYSA